MTIGECWMQNGLDKTPCTETKTHRQGFRSLKKQKISYEIVSLYCKSFKIYHKAHLSQEIRLVTMLEADLSKQDETMQQRHKTQQQQ